MTIQLVTEGQQIAGTSDSTTDVANVWCSLRPLSSRETTYAKEVYSEATYEIRLYYYAGLTNSHRFKYGTRLFEIVGNPLNPDETQLEHVVKVKE